MADDLLRNRLTERVCRLAPRHLPALEQFLVRLEAAETPPTTILAHKDWPHAPSHRLGEKGAYLVTAGTLHKQHYFNRARRLDLLEQTLLRLAGQYGWHLEAWAVFSNHYHFVGHVPTEAKAEQLNVFLGHLHTETAAAINQEDNAVGRQVWFNYWETKLTYERSYFARLHYVHQNPVKHGLVRVANQYRWCSAAWFERTATPAQMKTIYSFKTDKLRVLDDFDVLAPVD
jgi:putative transposase